MATPNPFAGGIKPGDETGPVTVQAQPQAGVAVPVPDVPVVASTGQPLAMVTQCEDPAGSLGQVTLAPVTVTQGYQAEPGEEAEK